MWDGVGELWRQDETMKSAALVWGLVRRALLCAPRRGTRPPRLGSDFKVSQLKKDSCFEGATRSFV